jgi:hypothetical protein
LNIVFAIEAGFTFIAILTSKKHLKLKKTKLSCGGVIVGRIRKPQSLSSLWKSIPQDNPEQFLNLLNKYKVTDSKGKYYHWDKFKWRVDEGDDQKLAWLATFIYTETDDFDLTYFIYNQVEVIVKAIAALKTYLDQKKQELFDCAKGIEQSPIAKKLKRGHLEILKEAVKEPGKEFTAQQVAGSLGISENTAREYLKKLAEEDLLVLASTKRVRTVRYLAPVNLQEKLYN